MAGRGKGQSWCEKSIDQYILCSHHDLELEFRKSFAKGQKSVLHILLTPRACMKHNNVVSTGLGCNHNTRG